MSYFNTDDATFNPKLEKINETDRVHADTPNQRFDQLIKNDVFLKNKLDAHNHDSLYANINHKHSEYIENVDLQTKLTGVAKERSEYSLENKAIEISAEVSNIKNSVDTSLQNVAKESEPKSIENRIKAIEDRMDKQNWLALPNLNGIHKQIPKGGINSTETEVYSVQGKGSLVCAMASIYTSDKTFYLKIEVDNVIVFNAKVEFKRSMGGINYYLGILNDTKYTNLNQSNNTIYRQITLARAKPSNNSAPIDVIYENVVTLSNDLYIIDATNVHKENITGQSYGLPATAVVDKPIKFNTGFKIYIGADTIIDNDPSIRLIYNIDE